MLAKLLQYREEKIQWLQASIETVGKVHVTFRINVPGAEKRTLDVLKLFQQGCRRFKESLDRQGFDFTEIPYPHATPEWLAVYAIDALPEQLKGLTIELEERDSCGRLYDFDVWNKNGESLSREAFGYPPRQCFICGRPAFLCGRERTHSQETLNAYIAQKADYCF